MPNARPHPSCRLPSRAWIWCAALLAAATLAACTGDDRSAKRFEASEAAKRYQITGTVRAVSVEGETLSVAHEAIPDLMDAMTMDFPVQDVWVLKAAGPGDRITGTLVLDGARSWIEAVVITKADSTAAGGPAGIVPDAVGMPLPDVALVNQDGAPVRPSTWTGRATVLTFIYTRCPLPDYCPLMMQRLNEIAARLESEGRRDHVWLAAVTLDPAFDTPAVLKAFGDQQIRTPDGHRRYDRFALLTGDPDAIRTLATPFQLTYEAQDGEIIHGLRTVVVDAAGRIVRVFRGSDWSVDDVFAALPPVSAS